MKNGWGFFVVLFLVKLMNKYRLINYYNILENRSRERVQQDPSIPFE